MKLTINIDVAMDLTAEEATTFLPQLFRDAFGEFMDKRCNGDAEQYMNQRYPEENYPWLDRAKKLDYVLRRYELARSLTEAVDGQRYSIEAIEA